MSAGLGLFAGFGVELEYMIVERDSLAVLPIADRVLVEDDLVVNEITRGPLRWSNELVLHVLELKTNGPAPSLAGLDATFAAQVQQVNALLAPHGGRLMPAAMHPWMDPASEMLLWPYGNRAIYAAYDRIFGCRGHGWANLQSAHLNLPFAGDEEFGRLHAAIRLALPLLPALAASSPLVEGRLTGLLDNRLEVYRHNQRAIPAIAGRVIPEPVFTPADYEAQILQPMYLEIAPQDPHGVLQEEWLNSRGAIARFERDTIEIRLLDVQESPPADLAILIALVTLLQALVAERWQPLAAQQRWSVPALEAILLATIREGEAALIEDAEYLAAFDFPGNRASAGELWRHLVAALLPESESNRPTGAILTTLLTEGTLSRRLIRALGPQPKREKIREVYRQLCDCLQQGRLFIP